MSLLSVLSLLVIAPAYGQWEPPEEVLQVRISGKGAWSVRCEYQDRNGKTVVREANSRPDRLHLSKPTTGSCTYKAASDQPLTIRLKSPLYRCSLPTPQAGICQQVFAAGASGQFDIRARD
jgi:hypothetical protein